MGLSSKENCCLCLIFLIMEYFLSQLDKFSYLSFSSSLEFSSNLEISSRLRNFMKSSIVLESRTFLEKFLQVLHVGSFLQVEFCLVSTFVDTAPRSSTFSLSDAVL